jgi:hypothetical protein
MSAYVIVDAELTQQITVGKDVSSRVQFRALHCYRQILNYVY